MIATKFGEKALKDLKDLNMWAKRVTEVNDQSTKTAIDLRMAKLSATPGERFEVVQAQVDEARMRRHFVDGRGERRQPEEQRGDGTANLGRIEYGSSPGYGAWGQYARNQSQYAAHFGPQLRTVDWENPAHPERGPQPVRNF